jgi:hypothetical protein
MIAVIVVRTFLSGNGAGPTEAVCSCDLAAVPPVGASILFQDGSRVAIVASLRFNAWPTPRPPGRYPGEVGVRCAPEPADRLPAVLAAGWTKLEAGDTAAWPA